MVCKHRKKGLLTTAGRARDSTLWKVCVHGGNSEEDRTTLAEVPLLRLTPERNVHQLVVRAGGGEA